jgi:hypothetical protein
MKVLTCNMERDGEIPNEQLSQVQDTKHPFILSCPVHVSPTFFLLLFLSPAILSLVSFFCDVHVFFFLVFDFLGGLLLVVFFFFPVSLA